MNTNQIEKFKASVEIEKNLLKLSFLSDTIYFWNADSSPLTVDLQAGFALCMEDAIKQIEKFTKVIEDCNQGVSDEE
jgi:hypothetical protein